MAQAYPRQQVGRVGADAIPLAPTPVDQPTSQWPTFSLSVAQRAVIRNGQTSWTLTAPLAPLTAGEVVLQARVGATGTLANGGTGALASVGAPGASTATSGFRTIGPQSGPAGGQRAAGAPAQPTNGGRPAPAPSGRIAPAQRAPQSGAAAQPINRAPVAQPAPRQPVANVAPAALPRPHTPFWPSAQRGQGAATPDALGQGISWASLTLSVVAVLICWLSVLAPPLGLFPAVLAAAGVIVGHIAQRRTAPGSPERRLALVGVVLGYLGAIASVGLLIYVVAHGGG